MAKDPKARDYESLVHDACVRRNELGGSTHHMDEVHWMILVAASRADKPLVVLPSGPAELTWEDGRQLYASHPGFVLGMLTKLVEGKITPRNIDPIFDCDDSPGLVNQQFSLWLRAETVEKGRGTEAEAQLYLAKASIEEEAHVETYGLDPAAIQAGGHLANKLSMIWADADGQQWIVDHLRKFVADHPTTLPNLEVEASNARARNQAYPRV